MKISDLKAEYSKASAKVSELVRQLSLAGIATIWILRTGEHTGGITYSNDLLRPLEFFVFALGLDLSQYVYKTAVTGSHNWYYWRKYHDNEKNVKYLAPWNWPTNILFWSKAVLVIFAYTQLLTFIYHQLHSASPPCVR